MNESNEQKDFLDGRTLVAIAIAGVFFLGWNFYLSRKYPDRFQRPAAVVAETKITEKAESTPTQPEVANPSALMPTQPEQILSYEDGNVSFQISSRGMSLKTIRLKHFKNEAGSYMDLGAENTHNIFSTRLVGHETPLDFKISQDPKIPTLFIGEAKVGNITVSKKMEVLPLKYAAQVETSVSGQDPQIKGLAVSLSDSVEAAHSAAFFLPKYHHSEFFVKADGSDQRNVIDVKKNFNGDWNKATVASLGSQYFALVQVDQSEILPRAKVAFMPDQKLLAEVTMGYEWLDQTRPLTTKAIYFFGPKDSDLMGTISEDLQSVINFGFFGFIARKLLYVLKFFYSISGNWGLAIILLTLLVRGLLFPLNVTAFRSMKNMSKVAPLIKQIKEKYPSDNQKQSQEMMALYKEHKINPLGGCIPMLFQMPVFFALYQLLASSIELYQQPFALWIHDLSAKDPYYVLPVLMASTMFMQQKLTPSAMDPAQQKVMMFMPLLFAFLMATVPSGLTLYIFISTLFGAVQQFILTRENQSNSTATKSLKLGDAK